VSAFLTAPSAIRKTLEAIIGDSVHSKLSVRNKQTMKKLLVLIFAIGPSTICKAQQFSFQMNFVDAIGNTDSIILGFDITASDTIDPAFGEVNSISTAASIGLDVRASNIWWKENSLSFANQSPFQTKVQIAKDSCDAALYLPIIELNILTDHFPVTASWNPTLFQNICLNGSILTSTPPGGWWDTGGFRQVLESDDTVSFLANYYTAVNGNDAASVYWVAFSDSTLLSTSVDEIAASKNAIKVFPNPTADFVSISSGKAFEEINRVEFHNTFGQVVLSSNQLKNIDITKLPSGLYFIKATSNKGFRATTKLQKV
jgi:hypothetical protein